MSRAKDESNRCLIDRRGGRLCAAFAAIGLSFGLCSVVALAQAPGAPPESAAPAAVQEVPAPVSGAPVDETPRPAEAQQRSPNAQGELPSKLPTDLSPWGMFLHADIVVKIVMASLAFASLLTWTIALAKGIEILIGRWSALRDLKSLAGAADLAAAQKTFENSSSPAALFVRAAASEEERSSGLPPDGVKERIAALLSRLEAHAGRKMARGTVIIATIGATAPFVGLFGTVWGIMDSFIGISKTHTTNLAVVAPGIAEALLATAMGLVAAVPAVMIYNVFARGITGYKARLGDAAAEVLRHVSRDLDRAAAASKANDERVIAMRRPAE
jgi:biopolymer transport protein ExbB